ncbi:MAG: CAAD domain-containing protein [Cyanobacteria bacterium]|nr:CAAD domain-containing protein [Cyanobacteriota bacterium]
MADASALPNDDDQQPGSGAASLEAPSGEIEAPAEPARGPGAPNPIFSMSSPEPFANLTQATGASEGEPSPDSLEQPTPVEPGAEPAGVAWSVELASEPEPEPQPEAQHEEPEPEPEALAPEPAAAPSAEAVAPLQQAVVSPQQDIAPVTPPPVPTVATTIEIPARQDRAAVAGSPADGGEWALLLSKLQAWLGGGQLQAQLQAARQPLTLVAGLIALVVALQIYGALLGVIERLPLAPGLLELVGLISVIRFGLENLVLSQERRALIASLQQRWNAFRGKA